MARFILLGPPGSGKGTQAARLSKALNVPHIATGDLLRDEVARQTPLGRKARTFMDKGQLVPDALVVEMIAGRIAADFLLDGFPRSLGQAEALETMLQKKKVTVDAVFNLSVPDEAIVARLSARRVCPKCRSVFSGNQLKTCTQCGSELMQRPDDTPDTIRERLRVYREKTKPLEDYYAKKGLLVNVDAEGSVGNVFARILSKKPGTA
ncbi:MAG TPA: adenylate kinase [Candidatus Norongarragalinales archaeon]|nr:adenylate kinase [Candidatus Norongarragalinales archaeon]